MATQVFIKDENGLIREEWVQPKHIQGMLGSGWVVDKAELEPKKRAPSKKAVKNDDED